jgi:hypothetical protein
MYVIISNGFSQLIFPVLLNNQIFISGQDVLFWIHLTQFLSNLLLIGLILVFIILTNKYLDEFVSLETKKLIPIKNIVAYLWLGSIIGELVIEFLIVVYNSIFPSINYKINSLLDLIFHFSIDYLFDFPILFLLINSISKFFIPPFLLIFITLFFAERKKLLR